MKNNSNLSILQSELIKYKIDYFIINRSDEFLNEYISPNAERLQFITNFSGSAGKAIIGQVNAFLYVDGRYTLQANEQTDKNEIITRHLNDFWSDLESFITKSEINIALDTKLHSIQEIEKINIYISNSKSKITFLEENIIDNIWKDQPEVEYTNIFDHPIEFAGETRENKISKFQKFLQENNLDHYLISGLDNIAWLLNIRAGDIKYTPLCFSYLLISRQEKSNLYLKNDKINTQLREKLLKQVNINSIENVKNIFSNVKSNQVVGLDFSGTTFYFLELLQKKNIKNLNIKNPCIISKAIKNKIEIKGAINANVRDGVSITKYIYWLKSNMDINNNNEISSAKYLETLREKNKLFHSLSFDTISAIGKNAALPHYRVNIQSNTSFTINKLYLVDSGAQYYDGTTDITRTIVLGEATMQQKEMFTRVLKGHIALSKHKFKKGTKGADIDYLARKSLNEIGCDYDHGTGHGIGSFLSVHEGPQRIAKKSMFESVELIPGMILSNEPGYYKLNEYGIRIENLIIIKEDTKDNLFFENISWCPIDKYLINKDLLIEDEIKWLNNYHFKVYEKLSRYLNESEKKWLEVVTNPI